MCEAGDTDINLVLFISYPGRKVFEGIKEQAQVSNSLEQMLGLPNFKSRSIFHTHTLTISHESRYQRDCGYTVK